MRKRKKNAGAVGRARRAAGATAKADVSSEGSLESTLDIVSEATRQVPERDWARLPTDLSKNVDHYLYGTKKKEK